MPVQLLSDDPTSFTVDSGNGPQQIAKTPDMMAPGGIYDQAKASQTGAIAPDAPMGISQPPPAPSMPPPQPAPTAPANQIPMMSAQNAPADPPPVSPPQMLPPPGGMSPVMQLGKYDTSVESQMMDPAVRAGIAQGTADETEAIKRSGQIKADLETGLAKTDADRGAIHDKQAGIEQDKATMIAQQHKDFQANVVDEYRKLANEKITPKSIFEAGNVGQNIAAGLALGLGALGQALTGKENTGLAVIQAAIARDLEVQKANIDNKRHSLNDLGVAYKSALEMGMSEKDAEIHAQGYALNKVADQAEQLGHASGSPMAIANADQMAAAARVKASETLMKATGTVVKKTTSVEDTPTSKLLGKGPQIPPETHKTLQSVVAADRAYKDIADTYEIAHAKGLTGPLDGRMQQIAAKFGIQATDAADFQQKLQGQLSLRLHDLFGGAVSEGERKSFDGVFPSGTDLPANFMVKLNNLRSQNARTYRDTLNQYQGQKDYTPVPLIYDAENPSNTTFKPATK